MNQPYVDHEYAIFVAEVASTFNEALLSDYLSRFYEQNPNMKAYNKSNKWKTRKYVSPK